MEQASKGLWPKKSSYSKVRRTCSLCGKLFHPGSGGTDECPDCKKWDDKTVFSEPHLKYACRMCGKLAETGYFCNACRPNRNSLTNNYSEEMIMLGGVV